MDSTLAQSASPQSASSQKWRVHSRELIFEDEEQNGRAVEKGDKW